MLVAMTLLLLAHPKAAENQDIQKSLRLWKEFGRPNAVDQNFWNGNPSYRTEHFEESRELSVALGQAEKGDLKPIEKVVISLAKKVHTWDMLDEEWLGSAKKFNLEGRTAMLIYKHLVNDYLDFKPVQPVLDSLKKLQKKNLIGKRWKFARSIDDFVIELTETAKPTDHPPGSIEAAVDNLTQINDPDFFLWRQNGRKTEPQQYAPIRAKGLDAIPALANALGTRRLTRSFEPFVMNRRSQISPVSDFVRDLIKIIADDELASGSIDKKFVLDWYDAKQKGKIKDWIVSRLFVEPKNYHPYASPWAFESLAKKYPYLLKWAYGEMIRRQIEPSAAMRGLEESALSKDEKLEILDRFLALDYDHVGYALSIAHDMDMARFDKTILRYISELPSSFDGKPTWVACCALGTDNQQVWDLVKSKIDQADPLMKMQLLTCFRNGDNYHDVRASRAIQMLTLYFDNKEVVLPKTKIVKTNLEVDLEPGLTVGQVAVEVASSKGMSLSKPDIPRKDKAGWQKIREQIESQYRKR